MAAGHQGGAPQRPNAQLYGWRSSLVRPFCGNATSRPPSRPCSRRKTLLTSAKAAVIFVPRLTIKSTTINNFVVRTFVGNPPSGLLGSSITNQTFNVTRPNSYLTFDRYDFGSFAPGQPSDTWHPTKYPFPIEPAPGWRNRQDSRLARSGNTSCRSGAARHCECA